MTSCRELSSERLNYIMSDDTKYRVGQPVGLRLKNPSTGAGWPPFGMLCGWVKVRKYYATNLKQRALLRAELDVLTETEFANTLGAFRMAAQPVKVAAQNAYRDVERGLVK